jgi:hypothetical protein
LISNQAPIIPLFFYAGVTYYDTNKIEGIYPNVLDDHPLEYIRRIDRHGRAGFGAEENAVQ